MEYNEFDTFVNSYRNIQTKIKKIDIEDKTSEIEKLEKDIRFNELEIQQLENYNNVTKFEEASRPFMEKIRQDEEKIEKLKEFNKSLEERRNEVKKLEEYKDNVKKSLKAQKDSKLEKLQTKKIELQKKIEETQAKAFSGLEENIKNYVEQYKNFIEEEKQKPKNAVKDSKYKEFLENNIIKLKAELINKKESLKNPFSEQLEEINNQIKSINQAYKEALLDFERINRGEQDKVYNRAWDEAIKENKRRDEEKAKIKIAEEKAKKEAEYNKAWDEAIEENKRRDEEKARIKLAEEKAKKEAEYNKAWDEAIEENKRRDEEKARMKLAEEKAQKEAEYNKAWDEAIEENKRRDEEKAKENDINEPDFINIPNMEDEEEPIELEDEEEPIEIEDEEEPTELENQEEPTESFIEALLNKLADEYAEEGSETSNKEKTEEDSSKSEKKQEELRKITIGTRSNTVTTYYNNTDRGKVFELGDCITAGKKILKTSWMKNMSKRISGNSIKGFLLRRKLNPIIIRVLNREENREEYLEEYINKINGTLEYVLPYYIVDNLEGMKSNKQINYFDRKMLQRIARQEEKLQDDFVVYGLEEPTTKKLISAGLRKIKGPKSFKHIKSFKGKSIVKNAINLAKGLNKKYDDFLDRIVVNNTDNTIEKNAISRSSEKTKEQSENDKDFEFTDD